MMKTCTACSATKTESEFPSKGGKCNHCRAVQAKLYRSSRVVTVAVSGTCSNCGLDKPSVEFHIGGRANGLSSWCKSCTRERSPKYLNLITRIIESKTCSCCNTSKQLSEFYRHAGSRDGVRDKCKSCVQILARDYREANPGVILNIQRNRRASKTRANMRHWDPELHDMVLAEADDLCRRLKHLSGTDHHVDHVIPLQGKDVCGLHVWYNWQVLDKPSNLRKSNRVASLDNMRLV